MGSTRTTHDIARGVQMTTAWDSTAADNSATVGGLIKIGSGSMVLTYTVAAGARDMAVDSDNKEWAEKTRARGCTSLIQTSAALFLARDKPRGDLFGAVLGSSVVFDVGDFVWVASTPGDRLGPYEVFSMLPGFSQELMPKGHEKESQAKFKRYMTMMDSMTNEGWNLSNLKLMNESRIMRIARGCGRPVRDVMEMLEDFKRQAKVWSNMKGLKIPKLPRNMNVQHMSKVLPPQMLKQIGGMGGPQSFMKQMGSAKDMMGMFGGADK
ncbi:Signal recognition particle 54 kDa protein 3 [Striga hermonthica]|uniref:Signal recognition particle 54 kDa protein 3 n=1 Tax=Striga hermonthica TaxID=68872 RepID=A0A9N7N7S2_STRHE|nr:Signal recognition particle 54 kDa protein 3 [Striga hermonthica]